MNELCLFAGGGGGLLATQHLLGFKTICYVEIDDYCQRVLQARIKDGMLDDAPIWDDVRTFDGRPWCGCVDLVTAGFPCEPFSCAGKRRGKADKRNLWPDTVRIINEVRPAWVFLENSPDLRCPRREKNHATPSEASYFGQILGDLARCGFDAEWGVLSARAVGANHGRRRLWVVAHSRGVGVFPRSRNEVRARRAVIDLCPTSTTDTDSSRRKERGQHAIHPRQSFADSGVTDAADADRLRQQQPGELLKQGGERASDRAEDVADTPGERLSQRDGQTAARPVFGPAAGGPEAGGWWGEQPSEPGLCGVDDGVANRLDRIRTIGRGQVPLVAATAWEILTARANESTL